ncbi:RNA polymerase sigma factor [Candidatus Uhrbacteria bacterium]|nr:RNA polymerase sigma factor [Candidatus Uhrbacteria bacterium]
MPDIPLRSPTTAAEESALCTRARQGDRAAVRALFDCYAQRLYGYLLHTLRDPQLASDCFQQTWLRAIEQFPRFEDRGASFGAWLFTIARNECRQHWRRRTNEPLDAITHDVPVPSPQHAIANAIEIERVLTQLHEDDRELLRLRYLADLPVATIARTLGIRTATAHVRIHRALRRARRLL